jgi:4-alpha-glucanotransferase
MQTAQPIGQGALDHLAELAGIEREYWDIWHRHHLIGADAKRRILAALGFATDDEAALGRGIAACETADWRAPLPPVVVLRAGEAGTVPLSLPADAVPEKAQVIVIEEGGAYREFAFRLAEAAVVERRDIDGRAVHRYHLGLPFVLPAGYHSLRLRDIADAETTLIVAPPACYLPEPLAEGGKRWGLSTQLYALRRRDDWGIGDFTALAGLADVAGGLGAAMIGLSPLHALSLQSPEDASPYSPSSRLFLNPLYIDVEAIAEFASCAPARALCERHRERIEALGAAAAVDYTSVAALKLTVLEALYDDFDRQQAGAATARGQAFARFCAERGARLDRFALFEALSERFEGKPWQDWPEPFRRPDSAEVSDFAATNARRIGFYKYLQWQADQQLGAAQGRARAAGLSIGLYRDLAVGCARESGDAWSDQDSIVQDAKIGCPPDPFNFLGQDWGVPPLHPAHLRALAYEPFIAIIRANMRHAGALRIDHVMGLLHLFWIPADGTPRDGAYVAYPFEDLLAILALESHRNRCLVVGEDLGTVPMGFRERMAVANVLSYRVLYFEKDGDRFKRPGEYPALALACVTTHDLATVAGFWQGADIALKERLALYPSAEALASEQAARARDRGHLVDALRAEGLATDGDVHEADGARPITPALAAALHAYLSRSPASMLLVQIDDLSGEVEQINVPGTVDERPNWRRRISMNVDEIAAAPLMRALAPHLAGRADATAAAERSSRRMTAE